MKRKTLKRWAVTVISKGANFGREFAVYGGTASGAVAMVKSALPDLKTARMAVMDDGDTDTNAFAALDEVRAAAAREEAAE